MNAPFAHARSRPGADSVGALASDTLSRADLARTHQWCRRRRPLIAELAGLPLQLAFTVAPLPCLRPPLCRLNVAIGGEPATIAVPADITDAVLQAIGAPPAAALGERSLRLALELAAAPALDHLERALGLPIALTAVSTGAAIGEGIACHGMLDGAPFDAVLIAPDPLAARLAALAGAPDPHPAAAIPVTAALRIGVTWMTVGLLASLRPGDVVMFDQAMPAGEVAAVLGERRLGSCRREGRRATLIGALVAIGDLHHDWTAADTMTNNGTDPSASDADLDEMQIKLLFEIGRIEISLGELRSLAPGYVFDLGRDPDQAVEIHAGSRRIGHGEVVRIGDTVGVRVVRLFNHD